MKNILILSLAVVAILIITSQTFALVEPDAGKYIYNEKEISGFNHLLKGGLK